MSTPIVDNPLELLIPSFDSKLTTIVLELEHLRKIRLEGDTPAHTFFQLKEIFHLLESLGSARIEGNRTTVADYMEAKLEGRTTKTERFRAIQNLETAMTFIEETIEKGSPISHSFIRELHKITVEGLTTEGDPTPGAYRIMSVKITGSDHSPPDYTQVQGYMDELVAYINKDDQPKYDLIKAAQSHHRFAWIHPFRNGNGRVVRLLTYAMLIRSGFNVQRGRILNPTAVFCSNRDLYYSMLSRADSGSKTGIEDWCCYVLEGIQFELNKLDNLTSYENLKSQILLPAVELAHKRNSIDNEARSILRAAIDKRELKAADTKKIWPQLSDRQRTYQIKKLVDANMLRPIHENSRKYVISFTNSSLLRSVMEVLLQSGFVGQLDVN